MPLPEPLAAAKHRCAADLAGLPPNARAPRAPTPVPVHISEQLQSLQDQITHDLMQQAARDAEADAPA
jgi:hypothetical protein